MAAGSSGLPRLSRRSTGRELNTCWLALTWIDAALGWRRAIDRATHHPAEPRIVLLRQNLAS